MIHVMLDLETWGTTPGSDIRSIGACMFDPVGGVVEDRTFYIACCNENDTQTWKHQIKPRVIPGRKYPLTRDPRTAQWWSEQSDDAQAAFADPVDLRDALVEFHSWLRTFTHSPALGDVQRADLRLWSHGASFDPPILAAAYEAVGLPVPWHYRAPRDTRTAFDMAGITDHTAWLNEHPGPLGLPHHALDDAVCQARAVCAAYERVTER